MCLCEEITKIKKDSFPELRFVKVTGNYVPDCHFNEAKIRKLAGVPDYLAGLNDFHIANISPWKAKHFMAGFAEIDLVINIHEEKYKGVREAIIAASLVNLVRSLTEKEVKEEIERRGYGEQQRELEKFLENGYRHGV